MKAEIDRLGIQHIMCELEKFNKGKWYYIKKMPFSIFL